MSNDTVTIDVHDPHGMRAGEYLVIGDPGMVVPGPPRIVKLTRWERLRSLRPWVAIRYEPTQVPSQDCVVIDKKIICHPTIAEKILTAARKREQ